MEPDDIECDGLGPPVIEDFSGKIFYNGFINHSSGLRVFRGDTVKVKLDELDAAGEDFSFAQVLYYDILCIWDF